MLEALECAEAAVQANPGTTPTETTSWSQADYQVIVAVGLASGIRMACSFHRLKFPVSKDLSVHKLKMWMACKSAVSVPMAACFPGLMA